MWCAWKGDVARTRWLLERGARVDAGTKDGTTALMGACEDGHLEIVRELLGRGDNVNAARTTDGMTSLIFASQNGYLEAVRELLGNGANVKAAKTYNGLTSLMLACIKDHLETSRLLLQHSASKTAMSTSGKTAYAFATSANAALRQLVKPKPSLLSLPSNVCVLSPSLFLFAIRKHTPKRAACAPCPRPRPRFRP